MEGKIDHLHRFRLRLQDIQFSADVKEGAVSINLSGSQNGSRVSSWLTVEDLDGFAAGLERALEIRGKESPFKHAELFPSGELKTQRKDLVVKLFPGHRLTLGPENGNSLELAEADVEQLRELQLLFADMARAAKGEWPEDGAPGHLEPQARTRPSGLASEE